MEKTCFKCEMTKPIECFHKHPRMKDGHLNKCAQCTVQDVREWRERRGKKNDRRIRYARELAMGKRIVKGVKRPNGTGRCPLKQKVIQSRYFHKRRSQTKVHTELDALAFSEAIALCAAREAATGIKWNLDHRVPLNHRGACGLHNAFNFQVVPKHWNELKSNKNMDSYWPT